MHRSRCQGQRVTPVRGLTSIAEVSRSQQCRGVEVKIKDEKQGKGLTSIQEVSNPQEVKSSSKRKSRKGLTGIAEVGDVEHSWGRGGVGSRKQDVLQGDTGVLAQAPISNEQEALRSAATCHMHVHLSQGIESHLPQSRQLHTGFSHCAQPHAACQNADTFG